MDPANAAHLNSTQFVPSFAVPTQTVMIQHLSAPHQPLSYQDIYVLQRTIIPVGQSWTYFRNTEIQTVEMMQVSLLTTPTLIPSECRQAVMHPAPLRTPTNDGLMPVPPMALGVPPASNENDKQTPSTGMTDVIYGP